MIRYLKLYLTKLDRVFINKICLNAWLVYSLINMVLVDFQCFPFSMLILIFIKYYDCFNNRMGDKGGK